MYLAKAAAVLKDFFSPCGNLASGKADSSLRKILCVHAPGRGPGKAQRVTEASSRTEALPKIAGRGNQLPRVTIEKQLRKQLFHPSLRADPKVNSAFRSLYRALKCMRAMAILLEKSSSIASLDESFATSKARLLC